MAPLHRVTPLAGSGGIGQIGHNAGTKPRQTPAELVGPAPLGNATVHTLEAASSAARGSSSLKKVAVFSSSDAASVDPVRPVARGAGFAVSETAVATVLPPAGPPAMSVRMLKRVTVQSGDWQRTTLRPVRLGGSTIKVNLRPVSTGAQPSGQTRLLPVAVPQRADRGKGLHLVGAPKNGSSGHALQQTMDRVGAMMDRLADARALIRGTESVSDNSERESGGERVHDTLGSTDVSAEDREVMTARDFVDRVRNKAIHVGENKAALVIPHPVYWTGNGLTERGLRDPAVQTELKRMQERQVGYMNRITPILQAHVDDRILRKGPVAMVEALPDEERAEALEWAKSGAFTKIIEWLVKDGERRSVLALERWKKARDEGASDRLVRAAQAIRRQKKWPLDLKPETLAALRNDADRHAQMLDAEVPISAADRAPPPPEEQPAPPAAADHSASPRPSPGSPRPDVEIGG